jgi:hypothetical protein
MMDQLRSDCNSSKVVLNVTTNDLHGDSVTDANTNVTPQTAGPLSIASNGEITLAAIHLLALIVFL